MIGVREEVEQQYSPTKIALIWVAAVLPMAVLGWGVTPLLSDRLDLGVGDDNRPAFTRALLLTIGLIWQFLLVMIVVRSEEKDLRWSTLRRRLWLNPPLDPKTGEARGRLWLWVLPFVLAFGVWQFVPVQQLWETLFPLLGEPDKYSLNKLLDSPSRKAELEGAWQLVVLFVVLGIFNTVLGEELLFRGLLLPRMRGAFGKRDWLANGVLFGLYHLHQPWSIVHSMVDGSLFLAYPSRRFHSAWMGIAVHSSQTVFFLIITLGLVLGAS